MPMFPFVRPPDGRGRFSFRRGAAKTKSDATHTADMVDNGVMSVSEVMSTSELEPPSSPVQSQPSQAPSRSSSRRTPYRTGTVSRFGRRRLTISGVEESIAKETAGSGSLISPQGPDDERSVGSRRRRAPSLTRGETSSSLHSFLSHLPSSIIFHEGAWEQDSRARLRADSRDSSAIYSRISTRQSSISSVDTHTDSPLSSRARAPREIVFPPCWPVKGRDLRRPGEAAFGVRIDVEQLRGACEGMAERIAQCANDESPMWKSLGTKGGVELEELRETRNSVPIVRGRYSFSIPGLTIEEVRDVFVDYDCVFKSRIDTWLFEGAQHVAEVAPHFLLTYQVFRSPAPGDTRRILCHTTYVKTLSCDYEVVALTDLGDYVSEDKLYTKEKSAVKADILMMGLVLHKTPHGTVDVTMIAQADMKPPRFAPAKLLTWMWTEQAKQLPRMEAILEELRDNQSENGMDSVTDDTEDEDEHANGHISGG